MGGFLKFLAFFGLLAAVLVLVVAPLLVGPLLTQTVRDQGVRSGNLAVTVALFDPTILLGRSRSMHVSADDVDMSPAAIGSLELTLGDVSYFDQSWATVDGEMRDIQLETGGQRFAVDTLTVAGPANAANATVRLSADETESLVRFAAGAAVSPVTKSHADSAMSLAAARALSRSNANGGPATFSRCSPNARSSSWMNR